MPEPENSQKVSLSLKNPTKWPYVIWFAGPLVILVMANLLSVSDGRQVMLPFLKLTLPETCGMRLRFGIDCPGCGLTRSFIYLAHGRISEAWALNAVSIPVFGFALLQLPLSLLHWYYGPLPRFTWLVRFNLVALIGLAVLLAIRWLGLLVTGRLF